jgi:hypothetical protein
MERPRTMQKKPVRNLSLKNSFLQMPSGDQLKNVSPLEKIVFCKNFRPFQKYWAIKYQFWVFSKNGLNMWSNQKMYG